MASTRSPALDKALSDIVARLRLTFGTRLHEVRLFGSVARGEAGPESDVDVLVLLDEIGTSHDRTAAMDVVADVALESDLPIEPLVLSEGELDRLRRLETALARSLDGEGIRL